MKLPSKLEHRHIERRLFENRRERVVESKPIERLSTILAKRANSIRAA